MNINLTLFGQAIAFAIFVAFCMKFVWPPLINAISERQRKIADGLNAAEKAKADLADAQAQVKAELDAAKAQAAQLIEEARTQAAAEGERIRQQAKEAVDTEINAAREELRQQVAALAVTGAEKILSQQVDAEAHNAMLTQLAAKL